MSTNRRAVGACSSRQGTALSYLCALSIAVSPALFTGCARYQTIRFEQSGPSLTLSRPALYPETIEYDPSHDQFLVSSFREGAVYRVDSAGVVTPLVSDPRLCSVLGIAVDARRGRLWAVNADLGASARPSVAGPKKLAAVGVYDLSTGAPLHYIDLAPLFAGDHLLNGIAVDAEGDAYVSDSFAPVIYKITRDGQPRVLLHDERFAGKGINLNGVVVHPDGYLLVIKKSDGTLFKIPVANPAAVSKVDVARPLVGGDGVTLVGKQGLVVIANQTPDHTSNEAFYLSSRDGWRSATVDAVAPLGGVYPTTAVLRLGQLYVLHSKLNELIQAPPERKGELVEQAVVQRIGATAEPRTAVPPATPRPAGKSSAPAAKEAVSRTLLEQHDLPELPGWESRLYLVEYGPGVASPVHHHPVAGSGYVVSGTFESAFVGESPVVVHAGQSFVERAGVSHVLFRNVDPVNPLRFVISFVARKGEPVLVTP